MKKFLMILAVLIFIGGCAARQVVKVPDAVQKTNAQDCIDADYKNDGGVFIKVLCPGRVIHVVARLKPQSNYAVLIGNDPIRIMKASPEGIIVFENPFGMDVEMIPEMSEEEMKEIKIKKGGE